MTELRPCGTYAAYRRHYNNGEPIDDECRRAYNAYYIEYQRRTGDGRARQSAYRELARRHPEEFGRLRTDELLKEEDGDRRAWCRARQRALAALAGRHAEEYAGLLEDAKVQEKAKAATSS